MTMGELWWERLVNSVRFLDDIHDALMNERSVVMSFGGDIPWKEIMLESLERRLSEMTDSRTFDILDVSGVPRDTAPGKYLLERFCSREERKKYWPTTHGSPERFLAMNEETPLNGRYVCITGLNGASASKWVSSVTEYHENCGGEREHALFILVSEGSVKSGSGSAELFRYEDYVSDYDCMMLCLTLISSEACSRAEKMYLCEAAGTIADNDAELAGLLVSEGTALIKNPEVIAGRVLRENGMGSDDLSEKITKAIWAAQIKLVFPMIENFRADMISKYGGKLKKFLPIKSSNNDELIENVNDLEIGQIFYIVSRENAANRIISDKRDFDMLKKMRDARNVLAHCLALPYEKLKDIGAV